MCGIAGLLTLDGRPADPQAARAMAHAIAHRGLDGEGLWHEGPIALSHRRLAIRDLSPSGAQPFHSACGRVVAVYNGEIYNEAPLRRELEQRFGLVSRSRSDAEIIPAGYLAWGLDIFNRIEGFFAIALWDRSESRLMLARDGFGIKPLYVQKDRTTLRFGSESKAPLADSSWRSSIRPERLHTLLALGHLGPADSLFEGVDQVPPGCIRIIEGDRDRNVTFWQPTRRPQNLSRAEGVDRLLALLPRIIDEQLVSDVPVGILQSGGIDSTLVTLTLPPDAKTPLFTVHFSEAGYDETGCARAVATRAKRPVIVVKLPDASEAEAIFRRVVHHLDGEVGDSSAFATFRLAEEVGRHVTVVLSGDGGDELFAGYPTYQADRLAAKLAPILHLLPMRAIGLQARRMAGVGNARVGLMERVVRFCLGCVEPTPHVTWRRYLDPCDASTLYGPALSELLDAGIDPLAGYARALQNARGTIVDRALLADQRYYLPADMLLKVDRTSMAHGLEVRVPLLDRRVADLAASIPADVLMPRTGPSKAVLRGAASRLGAPPSVTKGPKRGFNVPVNRLLGTSLRPLADRLCGPDAGIFSPYLRPDAVREFWTSHKNGRVDRGYVIWTLLTFAVRREQLGTRLADA